MFIRPAPNSLNSCQVRRITEKAIRYLPSSLSKPLSKGGGE